MEDCQESTSEVSENAEGHTGNQEEEEAAVGDSEYPPPTHPCHVLVMKKAERACGEQSSGQG